MKTQPLQQAYPSRFTPKSAPDRSVVTSGAGSPELLMRRQMGNRATADGGGHLQTKLTIGQPGDRYEQEADRVARDVVRLAPTVGAIDDHRPNLASGPRISRVQRACRGCKDEEEEERLSSVPSVQAKSFELRSSLDATSGDGATVGSQISTARGGGNRIPEATLGFMERGLGTDLGGVRLHTDERSSHLAASIGARAFTVGNDIFFHRGEYQPRSSAGKELLAHELVHTIQQTGRGATSREPVRSRPSSGSEQVQRAQFRVGRVTVNINYGGLHAIADAGLVAAIESRFITFTAAADASAIHAALVALAPAQQHWVLYALDLHQDNTGAAHARFNRTLGTQRLIAHAPAAVNNFLGAIGPAEEEALRASGWFEVALAAHLSVPTAVDRAGIDATLNPPPAGGVGAALDLPNFTARMDPAVRHLINFIDPARWPTTGTRNLPTLRTIGDELMTEAKDFFKPFAHTARTSVFGLSPAFHISANIFSVTALVPTAALRRGYLRNRATIVGRNTSASPAFSDTNIFHDVNFDGTRAGDRTEFESLIATLAADPVMAAALDRLIRHTGRQSGTGAGTRIGLSTEFNSTRRNECAARWSIVETLCHEIMHALAHPRFEAETASVDFGQVLLEGFPEVLSVQLFNKRVKPKAAADAAFKARMEAGLASAPCSPAPPNATVGYGAAGSGAESIRARGSVGDERFRSAFFLGQVHLLGL